jgi:hypothetical protein
MGIQQSFFVDRPTPLLQYITTSTILSGLTTYTFSDVNIDGPGLIIVGYHTERSGTTPNLYSSSTIGGSSATSVVTLAQSGSSGSTSVTTGLISRRITSGTTATIEITFDAAPLRCLIGIWRLQFNNSDTAFTTSSAGSASGTSLSTTLNSLPVRTVGVAVTTVGINGLRVTWTGATEVYDLDIGSGTTTGTSAANFTRQNSGSLTISTSHTNSSQAIGLVAAAWT